MQWLLDFSTLIINDYCYLCHIIEELSTRHAVTGRRLSGSRVIPVFFCLGIFDIISKAVFIKNKYKQQTSYL